jgi:predicted nucleotidyltransferase
MNSGLSVETINKIKGVFVKHPQIDAVILYGSRAKGNYRPGSDIDLTLHGEKLDLHILNKISNDLDDLLTPYKFDISIYHDIDNQDLIDHIKRVGVEFWLKSKVSDGDASLQI